MNRLYGGGLSVAYAVESSRPALIRPGPLGRPTSPPRGRRWQTLYGLL